MSQDIIDSLKRKYQGKKVLVVGLGLQGGGVGIARFFSELGAKVTVTDKKSNEKLLQSINKLSDLSITYRLGGHDVRDFLEAEIIFKGPSVPWSTPEVEQAQKKGIKVEMELSFFAANFPGKIIGVTGTRGKSTTTQMIYNILKLSDYPVFLGGGLPGISTINYLKTLTKDDWVVMEISSWALSGFHRKKISPHIAVFTNIYPDHLNYYKDMDEYLYDKKAIFMYQKKEDYLITNKNLKNVIASVSEAISSRLRSLRRFVPRDDRIIYFSKKDFPYKLRYLKGDHNLENAAAALKVAEILKIEKNKAVEIIKNFEGLPYRLQVVGKKENITFINDTTSTSPIATVKAIESFCDKKIILILGGNSKNLPTDTLIKHLIKVEKIILLAGSFTDQILDTLRVSMPEKISRNVYNNLEEAVKEAYRLSKGLDSGLRRNDKGNEHYKTIVLFSPAATSFAMFDNEFHRGREFNRIVKQII